MFKKITITVFAVLVSLSVGAWLGYTGHAKANAAKKHKTVEVAKDRPVEMGGNEPTELQAELSSTEDTGVPKWAPKPLPEVATVPRPSVGTPSQPAPVPTPSSQPALTEGSVFKQIEAGVLVAYQLKAAPSAACLPYAQRVAAALPFNTSTDSLAAYRARIHESVQSGYSIGCFVKQEQTGLGAAAGGGSQPTSADAGMRTCQAYLDAAVNRIRGSRLAENEKQQHLADLYAYAAQSRCAP